MGKNPERSKIFLNGHVFLRSMKSEESIKPKYMLLLVLSTFAFASIYFLVGKYIANSPLSYGNYLAFTTVLATVIVGAYQVFFWVQRNNYYFRTRCLKARMDDFIPFWPKWIWIYSFSYYILIGMVVASVKSIEQGVNVVFGGLILLIFQCACFMLFPCTVPAAWRKYKVSSLSTRFMKFVQRLDNGRNCFPSMHCSVAMYVGLVLFPILSYYSLIMVLLVAISCLFVKQHQAADIVPGLLVGWLSYIAVFKLLY
jgi:hypothetical protein